MKAKYEFEIMDLDDGLIAVPIGGDQGHFHGVLRVNETAAEILKMLAIDITEEQIVQNLMKTYDGDIKDITSYVHDYLEKLKVESIVE